MPASLQQSASNLKSVHLLRALLRQASYLPDATARGYFRRYIVSRYKAYQPKQNATASSGVQAVEKYRHRSFKRRQVAIINERTRPLLRKGQKGLNFLRRANQGEAPCLQKVLFFAYGRMGRRKYALLESLLRPDPIMDDAAAPALTDYERPTPLQELYYSNKRYLQYFDAPKATSKTHYTISISDRYSRLRTVVKSQHQKGIAIHRELKGPALKTPINNIWERPMPIIRACNNVRRWYAETMSRLLPPLPPEEWNNMHAMMVGDKRISLKKRRTPGMKLEPEASSEEVYFENTVEGLALDKPSRADRPAGMQRPHALTPRFMRRLYTKLLTLCCKLEYDYEQKRWRAIWGQPTKLTSTKIYTAPTDESLFAGVTATGQIPKPPKKSGEKKSGDPWIQPRNAKGEYIRFPFFAEYLPTSNPLRKELDEWKRKRAAKAEGAAGGEPRSRPQS